eukprot:gb/GEZN01008701.1/.p1 GENE.gb/GEZN01008701.1/~~gb/GEZN01008701.1/.p1  ORF type:complete len:328 (-),score=48.16 gb/GEZN01008701.1/:327-1310(-)
MLRFSTQSLTRHSGNAAQGLGLASRGFAFSAQRIGFIGLGNMGAHMASNLLKKQQQLVVFDLNADAVKKLEDKGAKSAKNPKELAQQVKIIITMLPSSPHVHKVYCGDDGILAGASSSTFLIDSSTIEPGVAQQVAAAAIAKQCRMVDAPVSGGVGGAEAGTLTFMVGGNEEDFKQALSLLQLMGKNIVHCGGSGMGQTAKVCNNLLLAISMTGVAEAMNLGISSGMDPKILASIINTSSGRCWSSDTYNPVPGVMQGVPASRDYSGGFGSALMLKDIGLALDAAKTVGVQSPLGTQVRDMYKQIVDSGKGGKDFGYIYEYLKTKKP